MIRPPNSPMNSLNSLSGTKYDHPLLKPGSFTSLDTFFRLRRKLASIARNWRKRNLKVKLFSRLFSYLFLSSLTVDWDHRSPSLLGDLNQVVGMLDTRLHIPQVLLQQRQVGRDHVQRVSTFLNVGIVEPWAWTTDSDPIFTSVSYLNSQKCCIKIPSV